MENIFVVQVCSNYEGTNHEWAYLTLSDAQRRTDEYLSHVKKNGYNSEYVVGDSIQIIKCKIGEEFSDGEIVFTYDINVK